MHLGSINVELKSVVDGVLPWTRANRRTLLVALVGSVTALLLLFNLFLLSSSDTPPPPPTSHDFSSSEWSPATCDSIYAGRRRPPRLRQLDEVRAMQEHAFDVVDPFVLRKPELELMVKRRSLPAASKTTLEQLNYGRQDEIPEKRRRDRVVYFITPTYRRDTQMLDLTRMSQTLQAAAYTQTGIVYWVVVEDAEQPTRRVRALLERSGLPFAHLARPRNPSATGRGMAQRNAGLEATREVDVDGVIYFADDDNAYDIELVTELVRTKGASVFNVALSGNGTYERCHVNQDGRVFEFIYGLNWYRKWGIDMAGFAFSTAWDAHKGHTLGFDVNWPVGELEPSFFALLLDDPIEFQPLAADCNRALVWHIQSHIFNGGIWDMPQDPDWKYISSLV